jgi:hypothetical protein
MFSFKTADGSLPPRQVIGVYRYFAVIAVIFVAAGLILVLGSLGVVVLSSTKSYWTYADAIALSNVAVFELFIAALPIGICLGIRRKFSMVYHILYFISAAQPKFWHNVPWTSYIRDALSKEFRDWFLESNPTSA